MFYIVILYVSVSNVEFTICAYFPYICAKNFEASPVYPSSLICVKTGIEVSKSTLVPNCTPDFKVAKSQLGDGSSEHLGEWIVVIGKAIYGS